MPAIAAFAPKLNRPLAVSVFLSTDRDGINGNHKGQAQPTPLIRATPGSAFPSPLPPSPSNTLRKEIHTQRWPLARPTLFQDHSWIGKCSRSKSRPSINDSTPVESGTWRTRNVHHTEVRLRKATSQRHRASWPISRWTRAGHWSGIRSEARSKTTRKSTGGSWLATTASPENTRTRNGCKRWATCHSQARPAVRGLPRRARR